jgi:hypothetical protein
MKRIAGAERGSSGRHASRFRRCIRFRPIRNAGAASVALLDLGWRNRVSRLPSAKRMPISALGPFLRSAQGLCGRSRLAEGPGSGAVSHFETLFRFGARSWPCSVARPVRVDPLEVIARSGGPFGWSGRSGTG